MTVPVCTDSVMVEWTKDVEFIEADVLVMKEAVAVMEKAVAVIEGVDTDTDTALLTDADLDETNG